MDSELIIKELDVVLLIKGCNYYERSTLVRLVRYWFRGLFILKYVCSLSIYIATIKFNAEHLFTMINIWFEGTLLLMYLYFVFRQGQFKRLFEDMLSLCFVHQRQSIRRVTRWLAFFALTYAVVFLMAKAVGWYGLGTLQFVQMEMNLVFTQVDGSHYLLAIVSSLFFALCSWSSITSILYILYVYLIKKMNDGYFGTVAIAAVKARNFHQLRLHWLEICRLKDRFERLASFFPFFWFANTFMKCTGAVVASKIDTINQKSIIRGQWIVMSNWICYSVDMLSEMFTLIFVDHVERHIKQSADDFVYNLVKSMPVHDDRQAEKLIRELERDANLKLTGWSFFDLKRNLILSLIGAAIPFTVLFVQLIDTSHSE